MNEKQIPDPKYHVNDEVLVKRVKEWSNAPTEISIFVLKIKEITYFTDSWAITELGPHWTGWVYRDEKKSCAEDQIIKKLN